MRFQYSTTHPSQRSTDALPRIEILLTANNREQHVFGLVDSGSTINVMPHEVGLNLGCVWEDRLAKIDLTGNLAAFKAMPVAALGKLGDYPRSNWFLHGCSQMPFH